MNVKRMLLAGEVRLLRLETGTLHFRVIWIYIIQVHALQAGTRGAADGG